MTVSKLAVIGVLASMTIAAPAAAQTVFGVTGDNRIVTFDAPRPGTILTNSAIAGLPSSTVLTGIDFRPATGQLYTVSTTGVVYRLDQTAGGYTAVSTGSLTNASGGAAVTPSGSNFGFDFNPVPDRLRLVSAQEQNLRINVDTGVTNVDGFIQDEAGARSFDLIGAAYTNSFPGATSTVLYGVDGATASLVRSPGPAGPNAGIYARTNTAGTAFAPLGIVATAQTQVGFDILFSEGVNLAFLSANDTFYSVNLTSGVATAIGAIGLSGVRDFTLAVPEPSTWAMMIFGFLGVGSMLRRQARRVVAAA